MGIVLMPTKITEFHTNLEFHFSKSQISLCHP